MLESGRIAARAGAFAADRYGQKAWDQFNTPSEEFSTDPTNRLTSLSGTRMLQWRAAWDSWEAIERFAGKGRTASVIHPAAADLLTRHDERSEHFEGVWVP